MSGEGIGVTVPDDGDQGPSSAGASSSLTPQPPWQSIPKFTPGYDKCPGVCAEVEVLSGHGGHLST